MFTERAFGLAMETRSQVLEGAFSLGKGSCPAELVRRDIMVPATHLECALRKASDAKAAAAPHT